MKKEKVCITSTAVNDTSEEMQELAHATYNIKINAACVIKINAETNS